MIWTKVVSLVEVKILAAKIMLRSHHYDQRLAKFASPYICLQCQLRQKPISRQQSIARKSYGCEAIRKSRDDTWPTKKDRQSRHELRQLSHGEHRRNNDERNVHTKALAFSRRSTRTSIIPSTLRHYADGAVLFQRHASTSAAAVQFKNFKPIYPSSVKPAEPFGGIRSRLRIWQEEHGHEVLPADFIDTTGAANNTDFADNMYRLPHSTDYLNMKTEQEENEYNLPDSFDDLDSEVANTRWFQPGDLLDVDFQKGQIHEVAVFVRYIGNMCQLFTLKGKWLHTSSKTIQFRVQNWMAASEVEKLLPYMPKPEDNERGMQAIAQAAYMSDLSIPRAVSGPIVTRLAQFSDNVREIYRKHASILDNAHGILARETDLRYTTLQSAASTLLKTHIPHLTPEKLCAVFHALIFAGIAFDFDKNSFRETAFLQIRSKQQVRNSQLVVKWVREWQVDQALKANIMDHRAQHSRLLEGTEVVNSFVEKTREIVRQSREDRAVLADNVGISQHRYPISSTSKAVHMHYNTEFDENDRQIIRFLYSWTVTRRFGPHPSLSTVSSLILQHLDLYPEHSLSQSTGVIFLEEIGTILPYENRARHDTNLRLAVGEYNRPLQRLISQTDKLRRAPDFKDAMQDLRHDWKDMAAYSIDNAHAVELDDAISVEPSDLDTNGRPTYWAHIHVSNPTAFFDREHAIAELARHQGETVYFPEHVYRMLPSWVSESHFSLDKDRPCLTFSARLNDDGEILETTIRPGTLRNHVKVTYDEMDNALGTQSETSLNTVLTVGGMPPSLDAPRTFTPEPKHHGDFKLLKRVGKKLEDFRKRAGGILWDNAYATASVWESEQHGLSLDPPYWAGSRRVSGDPVIRVVAQSQGSLFAPEDIGANGIVREMMLLAGEIAGRWCHDRQVPAIYRGIIKNTNEMSAQAFHREYLTPFLQNEQSRIPIHLGKSYMRLMGEGAVGTTPMNHQVMGRSHYCKVTSPLRRYGDMILHWQIEAALRFEAEQAKTLADDPLGANRKFLPFRKDYLDLVCVSLRAREKLISRAKSRSIDFWIAQLMFRARNCGEPTNSHIDATRPADPNTTTMARLPDTIFVHIGLTPAVVDLTHFVKGAVDVKTSISWSMEWPQQYGLESPCAGDIWEIEPTDVSIDDVRLCGKPLRLVKRVGRDGWVGWMGDVDELGSV